MHMTRSTCGVVILSLLLVLSRSPSGQQGGPAGAQPGPTFRLATEFVQMDVRVLDNEGRFIPDVTQSEVTVVEDGVRQTIDTFTPLIRGSRAAATAAPSDGSRGQAETATEQPVDRIFVIFLDDFQVDFQRTPQTIKLAMEFIERHLEKNDLCAVITSGGGSTGAETLTRDRTAALAAVKRFIGQKTEPESIALFRGTQQQTDPQRAYEARASLQALQGALMVLGRVQGISKSVVMFSEGMNYNYEEMRRQNASALISEQEQTIALATIANVAIHVIDPRMLYANQDLVALGSPAMRMGADSGGSDNRTSQLAWRQLNDGFRNDVGRARSSMRDIATSTGGIIGIETNRMTPVLARIMDATSGLYVLGYRSSNPRKPGKEHKVKVTISRPKVRVVARPGYREPKN